jgi:hypothetical protein
MHGTVDQPVGVPAGEVRVLLGCPSDLPAFDLAAMMRMRIHHPLWKNPGGAEEFQQVIKEWFEGDFPPGTIREHLKCHGLRPWKWCSGLDLLRGSVPAFGWCPFRETAAV